MRPNSKSVSRNTIYTDILSRTDPDIIILTETNSIINFGNKYFEASTTPLPKLHDGYPYKAGENRVTIFSKYPFTRQFETADSYSSICVEILTPFGQLIIYGTIIGFLGGIKDPFANDLENQMADLSKIAKVGNICFAGDLNISFSGYPYPSHMIRKSITDVFDSLSLINLTAHVEDSVIHGVFSKSFLENKKRVVTNTSFDKKITDHNLINISIGEHSW